MILKEEILPINLIVTLKCVFKRYNADEIVYGKDIYIIINQNLITKSTNLNDLINSIKQQLKEKIQELELIGSGWILAFIHSVIFKLNKIAYHENCGFKIWRYISWHGRED